MAHPTQVEPSFLHRLAKHSPESEKWGGIRETSVKEINANQFPHKKIEEWRFTDLKTFTRTDFVPFSEAGTLPATDIEQYYIPESDRSRLVFINGMFQEKYSSIGGLGNGVTFGNLADYADHKATEEYLNKLVNYENDVFVPFNGLMFEDGAFIHLEKGAKAEAPIQVLNLYTDSKQAYIATPRMLVVAEEESDVTIIEDHIGLSANEYMTIPVCEVKAKQGAHIHHVRIQRDSRSALHVSRPIAYVGKNSEYHSYTITLGAKLSRNEPRVVQEDEEVDFTLDGLVLIDGEQIADTHSVMDHRFSHANSHQLHKVVVNGKAHSIFNGKIFVRRDAQKIDSFQENRNLLLSIDGLVNTKPQLEIFADDVLCSHGATIGQLDPEEVFYLQSRGMTEEKAKEVLTYAFALETIENMKVESVHKLLIDEVYRYTKANNVEKVTV
ncbi:Fe-S cluster assembly protein SufD [Rhodohalobacter barkolensis]|uniref:Fe-S cluster assembly protein SufD n=1 Tax=Rhodohalobacter barkolensis TaxID=2053187 RepID=A0A2N0VKR0_9BACT|nr:Fe-S cluster assembly protein SufD [Rhodohalobacter barkolensis]PKD44783.1 Fe-S cluster assembly protein SufD [Rhodohalobacter barkolensis]